MKLTIVGSSGSVSGPESVASCYLLQADDESGRTWSVLLDLGPGAVGQAMNYLDPATVDAVLISHLHADHIADLAGLEVLLRYGPGAPHPPMTVYGPEATSDRIAQLCGESGNPDQAAAFTVRTWQEGEPVHLGPFAVEPFAVEHPVPAYAMRITGPGIDTPQVLTYTGDTDLCAGVTAAARGADLLLAEAAFQEGRDRVRGIHLTGRRAGQLATDAGAQRLILTHIPPWTCAQTVHGEARTTYTGPLDVAHPGATWQI